MADHVDAQGPAARPYRGGRPFRGSQEIAGVRQERLAVDGEPGTARSAGEQPGAEVLLQRGDPLGHGLLGDGQPVGGLLEAPRVRHGDEGAYGVEIHAGSLGRPVHNLRLCQSGPVVV